MISKLGDHCGLPLLFGVQTQAAPCSIVLKFFGHKDTSVTIYRAACKKNFLSSDQWKLVVNHVCEALQHVHTKGYLHNDLKANNVVLEDKSRHFNPVIIDFGKSTKIDSPMKKKSMTKSEQKIRWQSFPHIAPEIINGTRTHYCQRCVLIRQIGSISLRQRSRKKFGSRTGNSEKPRTFGGSGGQTTT